MSKSEKKTSNPFIVNGNQFNLNKKAVESLKRNRLGGSMSSISSVCLFLIPHIFFVKYAMYI